MDYTLLTAAHIRKNNPSKMDARREQEYYENAEQSGARLESMLETAIFPASLAKYLLETTRLSVSQIRTLAFYFSYGWKVR